MTIVEHNDVDISPLFNWNKEFKVTDSNGNETSVFMRILGDADMNRARVASLRRSAELRKKLKDEDSDERWAYIKRIDDVDKQGLIALIVAFSIRDISEKANSKVKIKLPKQPKSDAKTSAHEKYQEEIDSYPERRREELSKLLEKEVDIMKESLEKGDKESLYNRYVSAMIDELCEQELLSSFKAWCAYLGSYADTTMTKKLFSSFDEFANLPSKLKIEFITAYTNLELYGDDLKKLQQVTR